MRQLDMGTVGAIGDAAERLLDWLANAPEQERIALALALSALDEEGTEERDVGLPSGWTVERNPNGSVETEPDGRSWRLWSANLSTEGLPGWRIVVGRSVPPPLNEETAEVWRQTGLTSSGLHLTFQLRAPNLIVHVRWAREFSMWDYQSAAPGKARRKIRQELVQLRQFSYGSGVIIDTRWEPPQTRESVMAQVIEWFLQGHHYRDTADVDQSCIDWFSGWASQIAHRKVDPGELYEIVRGSDERPGTIPPTTPGGHRTYYRGMLRRPNQQVMTTAKILDVHRSTVYRRLKRAGSVATDFENEQQLAAAVASEPSEVRKGLLDQLIKAGLSPSAARANERRWRGLPPEEQLRRFQRVKSRHA